jgi:DNA-binding transcriptional MocR family regulator
VTAQTPLIEGVNAAEIVDSVRDLISQGELQDGTLLPPVRALAGRLGLNRNTVAAAYRQLAERGVVEGRGRGGTVVVSPDALRGEGVLSPAPAIDLAGGNPDPDLLPDLRATFCAAAYEPPLYGDPEVLPGAARVCGRAVRCRRRSALRPVGDARGVGCHRASAGQRSREG